ncbi:MAG: dihydrodipicolinate synthase family protein [Gemmatimonadetes bacterium]|nr:dihydrodipicolinate synthase family protein [Gemmatimonadota bacterium]
MTKRLGGVLAPVVTTFGPDGALDLAAFRANIRAHLAAGLNGVVLCGSTGENPLVDDAERRALVEAARAEVPKDRWLIIATGAESTRQVLARNADAARLGADAALVVSPHYYTPSMTIDVLRAHYRAVADAAPLPILVYNIPKYTHFVFPPALIGELATHRNVIGMKDSSGDLELLKQYLVHQSDRFTVLTGAGHLLAEGMEAGARGGILAVSLFAGALAVATHDHMVRGDRAAAAATQATLFPMAKEIVGVMGVPAIKVALDKVGLHGGAPRGPLLPLDAAGVSRVEALLAEAGLLAGAGA